MPNAEVMENKLRCLVMLLLFLTCSLQPSLAGFSPIYGGSFSVFYNHSSGIIIFTIWLCAVGYYRPPVAIDNSYKLHLVLLVGLINLPSGCNVCSISYSLH